MVVIDVSLPSPEPVYPSTLADLSRSTSVISTSSSSDSLLLRTPRPRPIRTFSSPRSRSPRSSSPRNSQLPSYLTRDLGHTEVHKTVQAAEQKAAFTKARSKSRNPSLNGRLSTDDFKFGATLGEGSYSTVMRGIYLGTGQEYAIKVLDKGHLIRNNKMSTAHAEKNALVRLGAGHPGIVRLYWAFHDEWSLYFVLDLAKNGEMQSRIARLGSLSTVCTQYYAAQIVDAIDYMHAKGVIHRDLKPENVLLDDAFRIKITDFGTGKILEPGTEKAKTFVGTAQYVSPELLESNETSKSSDFWSLGCIIYQMIAGRFAFQGLSEYLTWQKIKQLEYTFPEGFDEQAKDLVQKLLVRNPADRLGAGAPGSVHDMQALRSHPFLATIQWKTLWSDPAPPLEAGLVKKDRSLAPGQDQHWEDVGTAWDDLVGNEGQDLDEIEWASDGEGPGFYPKQNGIRNGYGNGNGNGSSHNKEVGPMGEVPRYAARAFPEKMERPDDTSPTVADDPVDPLPVDAAKALSIPAHVLPRDTSSTRSASSSEGSPIEKLGAVLESLVMDRGRDRSLTPVQGNGPSTEVDLSSVLLPGETILFNSTVETRSPRRRASRLLPIPVTPSKSKTRPLVLTTHRLVCLKIQHKGRGITVKSEFAIRGLDKGKEKEKEKDSRNIVSVEPKGEREFVVMTLSKSHPYAAASARLASMWIQKINEALDLYGPHASNAPT